tara:strand:+ start:37613 stop:38125 length:513 start_codon:yes stop_codon:yes gene_type:complete
MSIQILCANNERILVDIDSISNIPPVLARLLGLCEGFAPPEVDKDGQLTFLKKFSIERDDFVDCIIFLRTGHIRRIDKLMCTFNILGGCDALDEKYEKIRQENEAVSQRDDAVKRLQMNNPLLPHQNTEGLFIFEAHPSTWTHDETWQVTSSLIGTHLLWWRKREKERNK